MSIASEYSDRINCLAESIKDPSQLVMDITKLTDILTRDVDKCLNISNEKPDDPSWQRLVVRTAFSSIESLCFKLNELAYCLSKYLRQDIPEEEEGFMVGYKKGDDGKINRCYPGLGEYVKDTLKICSRIFRSNAIDFSDAQWQAFRKSIEVRDRITHPKKVADLSISPQEYDMVADATVWFNKRLFEITIASSGVARVKWNED